jgi:hypothetical protein
MKTKLLAIMFLAGSSMFAAPRISVGVGFGGFGVGFNQAPPAYALNIPPCPGPGYTWVDGYWGNGGWVAGYWNAPPVFTYRVAPRFDNRFDSHFVNRPGVRFDDRIGNRDGRRDFGPAPQPNRDHGFDRNEGHR